MNNLANMIAKAEHKSRSKADESTGTMPQRGHLADLAARRWTPRPVRDDISWQSRLSEPAL